MRKSIAAAAMMAASAAFPSLAFPAQPQVEAEPDVRPRAFRRRLSKPRGVNAGPVTHRAKPPGHSIAAEGHKQTREIERRLRQVAHAAAKKR